MDVVDEFNFFLNESSQNDVSSNSVYRKYLGRHDGW